LALRIDQALPTEFAYVAAPGVPGADDIALLVHIQRCTPCEGGFDLGARFGMTAEPSK